MQAVTNAHDGLTKSAKTQELAFKQLGIPVKELVEDHGNLNKILPQVLTAFEKMPNSTEKAQLGMTLLGRGFKTILPLLHEGALGMKELEAEAKAYGVTLGGSAAQDAAKMAKAQNEVKFASLGLQVALAEDVEPALTSVITAFAKMVHEVETGSGSIGKESRKIAAAFEEAYSDAKPYLQDIATEVSGLGDDIKGSVELIKGLLTLNFKEAWQGVEDITEGGIKQAEAVLKLATQPFKDIGEQIVKGLESGFVSAAHGVVSEAESLAHKLESAIKDPLGILSPSKVMEKHGEMISAGLALGITKGAPMAVAASESVAQQIMKFWESQGFSKAAAAGFVGNAAQESSLTPGAPGGGLYQQSGDGASGVGSVAEQSAQVLARLSPSLRAALKRAKTPEEAANLIMREFERPEGSQPGETSPAAIANANLAHRERAAREAFASSGGVSVEGGTASTAAKPPETKLILTAKQLAEVAKLVKGAGAIATGIASDKSIVSNIGATLERQQAREALTPKNLTTEAGVNRAISNARLDLNDKAEQQRYYKAELKALQKEATNWGKLRSHYLNYARHVHGKAKREALDKAAEYQKKIETAKADAKELKGTIYSQETAIDEAGNALAAIPGEAAAAQAEAAANTQGGDLSAYQDANSKIDLEELAGILTPEQAKAAKTANAEKAKAGGFGALSPEGALQVMGDLREFAQATQEATDAQQAQADALKAHTEALGEATKALSEFTAAGTGIAQVESGSLAKSLADTISGQIAGVNYKGRQMTAGVGSAASY